MTTIFFFYLLKKKRVLEQHLARESVQNVYKRKLTADYPIFLFKSCIHLSVAQMQQIS